MSDDDATADPDPCRRLGLQAKPPDRSAKLGIARDLLSGERPINGLRHRPGDDTCGWYLWGGEREIPSDSDYFVPMHVSHVVELIPEVIPYLALPPGHRFLLASGYEDVWPDETLLDDVG